jgi:hypothetical protein
MLKENVQKPASSFEHYKQTTRMTMSEYANITDATMFVEEEDIRIAGVQRKVRRLYVKPQHSDFVGVGWIINEDIPNCMVCGQSFGMFLWPHHCRSCGNLVCHPCSSETVPIVELESLGEVRVCNQCYWGQHPVHASHIRKASIDESSDDNQQEEEKEIPVEKKEEQQEEEEPRDSSSHRIVPLPRFAVFSTRKLSSKELSMNTKTSDRGLFVNICVHPEVESFPEEIEFVVSDDIFNYRVISEKGEDLNSEIYHVVLRPILLDEDALADDEEQCNQVNILSFASFLFLNLFFQTVFLLKRPEKQF